MLDAIQSAFVFVTGRERADIDTDQIGGPSAGLAFTLALLDELTPGDLMGGVKVAATGTIGEDESVGAIGALAQKAVAVKAAGVKVFWYQRDKAKKNWPTRDVQPDRPYASNPLQI